MATALSYSDSHGDVINRLRLREDSQRVLTSDWRAGPVDGKGFYGACYYKSRSGKGYHYRGVSDFKRGGNRSLSLTGFNAYFAGYTTGGSITFFNMTCDLKIQARPKGWRWTRTFATKTKLEQRRSHNFFNYRNDRLKGSTPRLFSITLKPAWVYRRGFDGNVRAQGDFGFNVYKYNY